MPVIGADRVRRRMQNAQRVFPERLKAAMAESLLILESEAKSILDAEVYGKARPAWEEDPPDKASSDSLYQAFGRAVAEVAAGAIQGTLTNRKKEALFLEFGTDDEGTGHHTIPALSPVNGAALRWVDAAGEHFASLTKAHELKGIVPIRFMSRALELNRSAIAAIFQRHLKGLFDL